MSNAKSDDAPGHNKSYPIIVNGRPKVVTEERLSYLQVVQLAYPGELPTAAIVFTVTYSNPHGHDGSLVDGQEVHIKDGMIFNVRKTDKS